MLISPFNPSYIFQSLFSLHHLKLFLDELFPITHLLCLGHLNLLFSSLLNKIINLWLLFPFHCFPDSKLILCTLLILLLLLFDLPFLWSSKNLLSFLRCFTLNKDLIFLLFFDQLGFIENFLHKFCFFYTFLFEFFPFKWPLFFKFLTFAFGCFFTLSEELSLLLDCDLCLFFRSIDFSIFLLCLFKTQSHAVLVLLFSEQNSLTIPSSKLFSPHFCCFFLFLGLSTLVRFLFFHLLQTDFFMSLSLIFTLFFKYLLLQSIVLFSLFKLFISFTLVCSFCFCPLLSKFIISCFLFFLLHLFTTDFCCLSKLFSF